MHLLRDGKLIFLLIVAPGTYALGQTPTDAASSPSETQADVADISLDELLDRPIEISTKSESTVDRAPGIVALIEREEIEASGARTLGELLQMVPGFDSARASIATGEPVDVFFARGVKSDFGQTTLVLLNGRNRFNDLIFASPTMSHRINVDMIERIEVIRGPGSSLYGGSAFAGVVNIVTRDAAGRLGTTASALYGSHQRMEAYAATRHELQGWTVGGQAEVFGEAGRSYASLGFDRSYPEAQGGGRELRQRDQVTDGVDPSYDVSLNVSAPGDRARVQIWHTAHHPHPFLTGFYPTPALDRYGYEVGQTMANAEVQVTDRFSVGAHYSLMRRNYRGLLTPALGPPARDVRLDTNRVFRDEDLFGGSQRSDNAQVDATYRLQFGRHAVLIGASASRESMWGAEATYWGEVLDPSLPAAEVTSTRPEEGLIAYADHVRLSGALFVQDEWAVSDTLSLTAGLRYDRYADVDDALILSPRAAAVWTPSRGHVLKAIYGQGFRPPSGFEQRGIYFASATGTRDIRPERIYTGELAYITYFDALRLQASGYASRVTDNIVAVDDGDPNKPNRFANSGQVRIFGGELELRGRQWWLNYSAVQSQSRVGAADAFHKTPFIAGHQLSAGGSLTLTPALRISSQVVARSRRSAPGYAATPVFFDADLKLRYTWRMLEASTGVTNLINQQYAFPLNDGGQYAAPYRGRELYLGLKVQL